MKNYILVVLILFLTSCKTTPEDYSKYPFIDQGIQSDKYQIDSIFIEGGKLITIFGHRYPADISEAHADEINKMPLILYDKKNNLYFRNINKIFYNLRYNIPNYKIDTLNNEDIVSVCNSYANKENKFVNFKFPYAEKYYTVLNEENHSEISEKEKKKVLEKYKNSSEEIKQDIIKTRSLRYKTIYSELHMPKENIHFKFNSNLDKNIEFFGNEELYKKGYIYMYIYSISSQIPHSGGLYLIRPKEKK
ncbi:hypothetical protein O2K51_14500 [Apibacter raozihei]|uniref:hypothetical protein n=1 Tax=Apibacter raozihei TaxID=2500547 RepID=UPI000FE3B85E|nr:hypothetical protein [Apibacter raozihei]